MQPAFLNSTPSGISEQILWLVKNSGLNFSVKETAFSLNIQLKKTFIKKWSVNENLNNQHQNQLPQEFICELEARDKQIYDLEKSLETLKIKTSKSQKNIDDLVADKLKPLHEEKRSIQIKHEKICAENKILKTEHEDLKSDLNVVNVALKSSKKENNDAVHRNKKKVEGLEDKLKELAEFKIVKESEEKDLKLKIKKADKKLKSVQEKEAKLKVAKNSLDRSLQSKSKVIDPENNQDEALGVVIESCVEKISCCAMTKSEIAVKSEKDWTANVPTSVKDWFEERFKTKFGSS